MIRSPKFRTARNIVALLALSATTFAFGVQRVAATPVGGEISVSMSDGVTSVVPGSTITYTITITNSGTTFIAVNVWDQFPAALTGATFSCSSGGCGSGGGSGDHLSDSDSLAAGASVSYTVHANVSPAATGTLSNTVSIDVFQGTDTNLNNNTATDSDTLTPQADESITKTDGVATATPGGSVTYTITASNAGPSDSPGSMVVDNLPATLTGTWTCVGAGGGTCSASGSGSISDLADIPAGGSVTYTLSATIAAGATGSLSNSASITSGATDTNTFNNGATDTDTLGARADLSITKTDGVTTAAPGGSVTYTITASNAGPSDAAGATVTDSFPASQTATWTCVGAGGGTCTASGSGNINDTVNLPSGGSVTYTVTATVSASASGTLSNTATVTAPDGVTDSNSFNNEATDTDTLGARADLSITKTDGVTTATPGGSVTYTITASNSGPSNATGATVADTFPASQTATWTCVGAGGGTCTASGSGNIDDTVNLPSGGSVTYTVTATVSASASGTLSNTATVTAPDGVTDSNSFNNEATDTDTLVRSADLSITKTDGVTGLDAGATVTYTITASNGGPSNITGATVADTFPASLTATWTCIGTGGGTCTASGSGDIDDTVDLPSGATVTYTATATLAIEATGTLTNTATVTAPDGVTDSNSFNNEATDTDSVTPAPVADLSIHKAIVGALQAGSNATYTLTVTNDGPDAAPGTITVTDVLPSGLTFVSANGTGWVCGNSAGTVTCTKDGLANGASSVITLVALVSPTATGTITNTATVDDDGTSIDGTPANGIDRASLAVLPLAELPNTGSGSSGVTSWALILLMAGTGLTMLARRSRPTVRRG